MPLIRGDLSNDGNVDILDVQRMIYHIIKKPHPEGLDWINTDMPQYSANIKTDDVNSDSEINILDVQRLIYHIIKKPHPTGETWIKNMDYSLLKLHFVKTYIKNKDSDGKLIKEKLVVKSSKDCDLYWCIDENYDKDIKSLTKEEEKDLKSKIKGGEVGSFNFAF